MEKDSNFSRFRRMEIVFMGTFLVFLFYLPCICIVA